MLGSKKGLQQSKSQPGAHDIGQAPGHVSKGDGPTTGMMGGGRFLGAILISGAAARAGSIAPQHSGEHEGAQLEGHCALQICPASM